MTASLTPKRHDTTSPLTCCPRCHKAELLGRARRRPVFRYDRVDAIEQPSTYDMYHGDQHVATLRRRGASGSSVYEIRVMSHTGDQDLLAGSLRDARRGPEGRNPGPGGRATQTRRGPGRETGEARGRGRRLGPCPEGGGRAGSP